METSSIFDDRIAPDNKTKVIGHIEMEPPMQKSFTDASGTLIGERQQYSASS